MNLQFVKKHPKLSVQSALGISKKARADAECRSFLCRLDGRFRLDADDYYNEVEPILAYLNEKLSSHHGGMGLGILELHLVSALYCFMRAVKPSIVIETGTANGASTYAILQALTKNGNRGMLYSIDLPQEQFGATNRPDDLTQRRAKETGWLAREGASDLSRWQLHLGNSHELLPKLAQSLGAIDVFIHDSEHTYETMMFEFETAWPCLKPNGYLLSDDLNCSNAFQDFCRSHSLPMLQLGRFGYAKK